MNGTSRATLAGLAVGALLALSGVANATTYSVNHSVGSGSVFGFLATDGTLGTIGASNFVDWSIRLRSPDLPKSPARLDPSNSTIYSIASAGGGTYTPDVLLATDERLDFSFDGLFKAFYVRQDTGGHLWCLSQNALCGAFDPNGESISYLDGGNWALAEGEMRSGVFTVASVAPIPLPAGLPLLLTALAGLVLAARGQRAA